MIIGNFFMCLSFLLRTLTFLPYVRNLRFVCPLACAHFARMLITSVVRDFGVTLNEVTLALRNSASTVVSQGALSLNSTFHSFGQATVERGRAVWSK